MMGMYIVSNVIRVNLVFVALVLVWVRVHLEWIQANDSEILNLFRKKTVFYIFRFLIESVSEINQTIRRFLVLHHQIDDRQ